jgi:hypothetical protein
VLAKEPRDIDWGFLRPCSSQGRSASPGMPHCYTGGPAEHTMHENNATWAQRVLPEMVQHMLATAPKGADTASWQY